MNLYLLNTIMFGIFLALLLFILVSAFFDYRKKRVRTKSPFVSFIIPTYNDADSLANTLKSVYDSYDKKHFEILIVNDCSKDHTMEVLSKLKKQYDFKLICNRENLGKVRSINTAFKHTKGEIVFVVDSDLILNKAAVEDILARFEQKKVASISCRYRPLDKGFLPAMQSIEYGMLSLIQTAYNNFSTVSMWGGCMAIKRDAFIKAGMLSENAISEDMDMALKIGRLGLKSQESSIPVYTHVPTTLKDLYKQKLRWHSGAMQTIITNYKTFFKHPLAPFFTITYTILTVLFLVSLVSNILFIRNMYDLFDYFWNAGYSFTTSMGFVKIAYGVDILKNIGLYLLYPLFSVPYVMLNFKSWSRTPYKLLLVFPYSMVYWPFYSIMSVGGFIRGVFKYFELKNAKRGW